jgi:hypothetical protein
MVLVFVVDCGQALLRRKSPREILGTATQTRLSAGADAGHGELIRPEPLPKRSFVGATRRPASNSIARPRPKSYKSYGLPSLWG